MTRRRMRFARPLEAEMEAGADLAGEAGGSRLDAAPSVAFCEWCVRRWVAGPEARALVWRRFVGALSEREARAALESFERALRLIAIYRRGDPSGGAFEHVCLCDEARAVAGVLAASAELRVAVAAELAGRVVRAERAAEVIDAGMRLAPYLARLTATPEPTLPMRPPSRLLH